MRGQWSAKGLPCNKVPAQFVTGFLKSATIAYISMPFHDGHKPFKMVKLDKFLLFFEKCIIQKHIITETINDLSTALL